MGFYPFVTPSSGGFTNPMTTLGDLIDGASGGAAQRLGVGSAAQVLTVVSGAPAWAAAVSGNVLTRVQWTIPSPAATHNAVANELTAVNNAAGAGTVNLPTGSPSGTVNAVKAVVFSPGNTITISTTGSDVFNYSGSGITALTITSSGVGYVMQYDGSSIWTIYADDLPVGQVVQLGGDIGGTNTSPQVLSTHLSSPLPLTQGGTGQNAASAAALLADLNGAAVAQDLGNTSAAPDVVSTHLTVTTLSWASTVNLDPTNTRVYKVTQGGMGSTTFTVTTAGLVAGVSYSVELWFYIDLTGGYPQPIWTSISGLTWVGGSAPTLNMGAGALNVLVFETIDGGATFLGALTQAPTVPLPVTSGGTGAVAIGAGAVVLGGTSTTSPLTTVSGVGTSGNVLTSDGSSGPPYWAAGGLPESGGTMTGWLAPAVSALSFVGSGTTLVNAALGNAFNLTLTASTTTLGNPSNPVDGQVIRFRITQGSGGSFTLAYGTAYDFGATGAPTLSTAAGKVDVLGFEYVASLTAWVYLGSGLGF